MGSLSISEHHPVSFLLVGVGGQGTILASDILAEAGIKLGYDVKKAEVHGMSQRGGSVVSNLQWAPTVYSPIVPKGCADILIAFEKLEAVRYRDYLRKGGFVLVNDYAILPVTVSSGGAHYPSDAQIRESFDGLAGDMCWVKGLALAEAIGNARAANVVIIGALTAMLNLPIDCVLDAVEARVPARYLDVNRKAFRAGMEAAAANS
jgi:indolepyruvate ferredoxin oxidoreductase beta subunit